MTAQEIVSYAVAVARLVGVRGEAPREHALTALAVFGLSPGEASAVLDQGLAMGLLSEDPGAGTLKASREAPVLAKPTLPSGDADAARRLMLLRILLSTLPVVMWAIDHAGNIIYYEGNGLRRAGLPDGALVGQNLDELFPQHEATQLYRRALTGAVERGTWEFGGVVWDNWCFPLRDAAGAIDAIAFVSIDITDATRTEQELRARIETIERQQRVISELSTPIIEVWDKVLALPLLGVVDSSRAAAVMTSLLAEVVSKRARFLLLDLTGVEAVDTATASHMLDLIRAVRLLGAEGIITGIRPSVAQTMVTLGVGLEGIVTQANLRQALQYCLHALEQAAR